MTDYEVYATRFDDPHIVEDLVPARGLYFDMPNSDHGEVGFTATVEPGRSLWRPAITPPMSGVLIARDGQPCWQGWIRAERQTGPRTFAFTGREWGAFFDTCPAKTGAWTGVNDHALFREQIDYAQAVAGQDVQVQTQATTGAASSDLTVNVWDNDNVGNVTRRIADQAGGPEWYFGSAGTLAEPVRQLLLADRHGSLEPVDTLMYVEDTEDWAGYDAPPEIALLSDLFPAGTIVPGLSRRGGNVLAVARVRDTSRSATVAVAVGEGVDAAQIRATATASTLLTHGWPRITRWFSHSTVKVPATLARDAASELAAVAGIATGYSIVTLDGDPDWTQVPRGSTMQVRLDTDVYAGNRPLEFESRVQSIRVDVPDDGGAAQIQWDIAEVLEAS